MLARTDKRANPRLKLCYPIEVAVREDGRQGGTRSVTTNLSARGAYFKTFAWAELSVGSCVEVRIVVPHSLVGGEESIQLQMQTTGRIRRMDLIVGRDALGEDGLPLKGVAVEFDAPLAFQYFWA